MVQVWRACGADEVPECNYAGRNTLRDKAVNIHS